MEREREQNSTIMSLNRITFNYARSVVESSENIMAFLYSKLNDFDEINNKSQMYHQLLIDNCKIHCKYKSPYHNYPLKEFCYKILVMVLVNTVIHLYIT